MLERTPHKRSTDEPTSHAHSGSEHDSEHVGQLTTKSSPSAIHFDILKTQITPDHGESSDMDTRLGVAATETFMATKDVSSDKKS